MNFRELGSGEIGIVWDGELGLLSVSSVRRVFHSIVGSSLTFSTLLFIFLIGEYEIGGWVLLFGRGRPKMLVGFMVLFCFVFVLFFFFFGGLWLP